MTSLNIMLMASGSSSKSYWIKHDHETNFDMFKVWLDPGAGRGCLGTLESLVSPEIQAWLEREGSTDEMVVKESKGQKDRRVDWYRVIHYNATAVPLPHIFTVTLQPIATILPQHCYCVPKDYCYYCKHALSETSCHLWGNMHVDDPANSSSPF